MTTLTNPYIAYRLQGQTDSEWTLVEVTDGVFPETVPVTEGGTYEVRTMTWSEIASAYVYSPIMLFQAGEQGVWYDPSDLTTLYQDAAGTTPVTGVEQPVGRILDKSGRGNHAYATATGNRVTLRARYNLLTYSEDFSNSYWYKSAVTVPYADTIQDDATTAFHFVRDGTLSGGTQSFISGVTYTASVRLEKGTIAFGGIHINDGTARGCSINLTTGQLGTPYGGATAIATADGNGWVVKITATAAATTSTGQVAVYMSNINALASYLGTGSGTIKAGKIDLRVANDGVGLPAYQRVASATDYDTVGFPPYLTQTASTQFLVTNSINFSATDKMTVLAGIRKTSDAAAGVVVGLSADTNTNNGSFELIPSSLNTTRDTYEWRSKGTSIGLVTPTGYVSPLTNVLTGQSNISGDSAILRVNGVQAASSSSDQGTGNYGNWPLYLFMRGGSSLPFTGRLYQLIIRGAASSAAQITASENYVNQKTKAF